MDTNHFIEQIQTLLGEMSEEKKDEWILTQAKLTEEEDQQNFILSLTGEKKVSYMPSEAEIDTFCEKVRNGSIFVEFETHYYEFDSEGRYMDDWEAFYYDPQHAFSFLNRIFAGCHDLIRLEEYDLAGNVLNKVCRLEFSVEISEDSEDGYSGDPFQIVDVEREQMLDVSASEIGSDWITALLLGKENHEDAQFAEKLVDIMKLELCEKLTFGNFGELISKKLLSFIEEILEKEAGQIKRELEMIPSKDSGWRRAYTLENSLARDQHLLLDIRKRGKDQQEDAEDKKGLVLEASWKQIKELMRVLSYEKYIDDQLEIEEIWNICEALVRRDRFEEESWKVRKSILKDMIGHEYYDCYGCYDPIKMLAEKLYITDEETLAFADMLNQYSYYAREAADLYRQYGKMDQYVKYLETHLGKSSREYAELVQYYCQNGNEARARQIAEKGLQMCKEDLTELFIFLLKDAQKNGETERYGKLYASAKRRRGADIARINENL